MHNSDLSGKQIEFVLHVKDGKPRCDNLVLLDHLSGHPQPPPPDLSAGGRRKGHLPPPLPSSRREGNGSVGAPPLRREGLGGPRANDRDAQGLGEEKVQAMTDWLAEKGGVVDYGKFASAFPGAKKNQLEKHFTFAPEVPGQGGGRWQIMLEGVEPLTPEERKEREAEMFPAATSRERAATRSSVGEGEEEEDALPLEPSSTLRLFGQMVEWDVGKGAGMAGGEGYEDIIVDISSLPPEVQGRRDLDLTGCELTFEVDIADDGKVQARDVHLLLQPDGDGGWQLRRAS